VISVPPPNSTHTTDNLVLLAPCNASDPLQRWRYRTASGPSAKRMLRVATCNASDPYQRWQKKAPANDGVSSDFSLVNVGLGQALDSSVGGSEKWETRAPIGFAQYSGAAAQLWSFKPTTQPPSSSAAGNSSLAGKLTDSKDRQCLNVVSFTGPDIGLDPCKPPGAGNDGNEIFTLTAAVDGHRDRDGKADAADGDADVFRITNARSGNKCLAASSGPAGGFLYTVDDAGAEWCMMADGGKGSRSTTMSGQPCSEVETPSSMPAWQPGRIANGTVASLSFGGGGNTLTWGNRQLGASGPLPHHVYLQANPYGAVAWRWPEAALASPAGTALQLPSGTNLTDDDHTGGVREVDSSTMCMALTRGGNLEVWVGELSGHRLAVALFNRGIEVAAMSASWAELGVAPGTKMAVRDVWRQLNSTTTAQVHDPAVPGHGVTLLVLTPADAAR
jgi:hypothetical protein